jgi:hypothetical protein
MAQIGHMRSGGGINGLYQIVEKTLHVQVLDAGKTKTGEVVSKHIFGLKWLVTYCLINLSWIFFRANSLNDAFIAIYKIAHMPIEIISVLRGIIGLGSIINLSGSFIWNFGMSLIGIIAVVVLSTYEEKYGSILKLVSNRSTHIRLLLYFLLLFVTLCFGKFGSESQFIYFRF